MKEKVELILNELIKQYIKIKEPISSNALKELAQLNISPSTIRGYFQTLEKMGMIKKEHFASGSYPSKEAMEYFWRKNIPQHIDFVSLEDLKKKSEFFDIVFIIKVFDNQVLQNIYNVNNKFIVLEFENNETVIKYDINIYNLLKSLKYLEIEQLFKIFKHYNLNELIKKIKNFQKKYIINQKLLYNKFSEVNLELLKQVDNLYINKNNEILIKKFYFFNQKQQKEIYLISSLYSNLIEMFKIMKGGENGKTSS